MDDELGDFFAKKDKSKKKPKKQSVKTSVSSSNQTGGTGTTTPDPTIAIPPQRDDNVKDIDSSPIDAAKDLQIKDKKKTKVKGPQEVEDDQWKTIENRVDYSGLKITANNAAWEKKKADQRAAKRAADKAAAGKVNVSSKTWAKPSEEPLASTQPVPEPKPAMQLPNVSSGRYVPPSLRGGAPELQPISIKRTGDRRRNAAPNLQSNQDFPTLHGPAPESQ